jgi:hypothetical protein
MAGRGQNGGIEAWFFVQQNDVICQDTDTGIDLQLNRIKARKGQNGLEQPHFDSLLAEKAK